MWTCLALNLSIYLYQMNICRFTATQYKHRRRVYQSALRNNSSLYCTLRHHIWHHCHVNDAYGTDFKLKLLTKVLPIHMQIQTLKQINKTKHTQLKTDRGQDTFQYSNDVFFIVFIHKLVTRIICVQSNIVIEPCYIQVSTSKINIYVFLVLSTVHAHMQSKSGTDSPDTEGLAAT